MLPDADWRRRSGLAALVVALGGGETTRLIGGAVRDGVLGQPVSDIDMATRLAPEAVLQGLKAAHIKAVPTGIAHGTVTAVTAGGPVEVTTLRRDVATDGRHAVVAFTDDWREDAARRDFTINALSANPDTGEVFDYFGGVGDLEAGRVRFIGRALDRIAEDHLRILRFFRFFARFGSGEPDGEAYDACTLRANDLMALSRERIAAELLKLLGSTAPVETVRLMLDRDILKPVLPEIASAEALARLVAREMEFGVAPDPVRRLAALIGPRSAVAGVLAARLRLSKVQAQRLIAAVDWEEGFGSVSALAYRCGVVGAIDRLLLGDGDPVDIATLGQWERPVLPISGGTLIASGLMPGPVVARTLGAIERHWIDAGFPKGEAFDRIVRAAMRSAN